jgi:hypothetical protein
MKKAVRMYINIEVILSIVEQKEGCMKSGVNFS